MRTVRSWSAPAAALTVCCLGFTPTEGRAQIPFQGTTFGEFFTDDPAVTSPVLGGLTFGGSDFAFAAVPLVPYTFELGTFYVDRTFDFRYGQAHGSFNLHVSFVEPGDGAALFTAMVRGRVHVATDGECGGSVNILFGEHAEEEEGGCGGGCEEETGDTHETEMVAQHLVIGGYPVDLAIPKRVQLKPHDGVYLEDGLTQIAPIDGRATVTPEPASLALLASGVVGLGLVAARRKRGPDRPRRSSDT